jgi:hypothetical protein
VVLNYIDRLDGLSHLIVTGTCQDPVTGAIHVVGRSVADPPIFYLRSLQNGAWSGWTQIPIDIKAHQVVPAVYRNKICLFWLEVKVTNEPHQQLPAAQQSSTPPSQEVSRFASVGVYFTTFRNGAWAAAQAAKGKLFDKPPIDSNSVSDSKSIEALYTIKVQTVAPAPGYGTNLFVDVFRLGDYQVWNFGWLNNPNVNLILGADETTATHLGRAVFDGRFNDLELRNMLVPDQYIDGTTYSIATPLLQHAQAVYGPDAQPLLPLPNNQADPNLASEPGLVPMAGALQTQPSNPGGPANQAIALNFTSTGALQQNVGPLLNTVPLPFRVVGPANDLNFDPASYFFLQDARRSYYVESQKFYWTGSAWSPVVPSNPASVPFEVRYFFHRFHNAFTRLFWHQLGSGGFPLLYDRSLQLNPDKIDPSGADVFSFQSTYSPVLSRVRWDHDDVTGQDREFLDFSYNAPFSVYNWELFFHIPLYIAELLKQNQQFEDALAWFHYIFDPTRPGTDPAPKRFWIPKPLYDLNSSEILAERINNLLEAVNQGDANAVAQVESWRNDPFNPFLLADQRPVAYMKRTVMSYLDLLTEWADNLFASESREALSEATLLYTIASEILGPQPAAITPPQHIDESYDQLEPKLDAFANAMVDIENVIGGSGGGPGSGDGGLPTPQTFYFKIPPNDQLLKYWKTIADRLLKLRHCQNLAGQELQLALFDAPIDPGLLIKAQAAGVDIGSVLSDVSVALPNYRFTSLYTQALDFVNAVRAYGALLLAALEKKDADQLAVLLATNQQQLLQAGDQISEWQVEQAQNAIAVLEENLTLGNQRLNYFNDQKDSTINAAEYVGLSLSGASILLNGSIALIESLAAGAHLIPFFTLGVSGFGGSPEADMKEGGLNFGHGGQAAAAAVKAIADTLDKGASLANAIGKFQHTHDDWHEKAAEAQTDIDHSNQQIAGAQIALEIAQQNQTNHQLQIDQLQKQIDFLTGKFTNQDLYDWMVGQLADTYFQSYKLAYRLCKQVERCYRFETGIQDSSFIQFGYWDSLHKGLLAGETLNHDLRRMQSSYLDANSRRFEISRFVSLAAVNPSALQQLLVTGACDFDLPESLFDSDYPGHYNRHLLRVSVTVVYPSPGKFDNVKATLTLTRNKVRVSTDTGSGYAENPVGSDSRFLYTYGSVPQKIAMGNAQDDPGLFLTALNNNLSDPRYLPFENAGAISSWHFEMQEASNEIDLSTVGDLVLHVYYTAVDGGEAFKGAVQAENAANLPTNGVKVFSAQNDFSAPAATAANPFPQTPWQAFLSAPAAGSDQLLTLGLQPGKFPPWTRGKTITVTTISVLAIAWAPGNFVLEPQAPLPNTDLVMAPLAGVTEPNICAASITPLPNTGPGTWTFKLRKQSAADFHSLGKSDVGDVFLLVDFQVS